MGIKEFSIITQNIEATQDAHANGLTDTSETRPASPPKWKILQNDTSVKRRISPIRIQKTRLQVYSYEYSTNPPFAINSGIAH